MSNEGDDHVQSTAQDAPADAGYPRRLWNYFRPRLLSVNIGHLLLILLALHLFAMSFPNNSGAYVFDESYYVGSSHFDQDLLNLVQSNLEHPFFGKIWGAFGIYLFGDNFFGWRILYSLIGVATVWVFYELAFVFFSKEKALFAASLLGFETLFFVHTTAALLEGPPLLFGLLGFLLFFKKRYYLASLALGLSVLSKEWGIYFIVALVLYVIYTQFRSAPSRPSRTKGTSGPFTLLICILILALVVLVPLWGYDLLYHPVVNGNEHLTAPWSNFAYYYSYQNGLKLSASDALDPWHYAWNWINPLTVSPDTYYAVTVTFSVNQTLANGTSVSQVTLVTTPIDWVGIGNLVIWYSFWAIVPYIIIKPLVTGRFTRLEALVGSWLLATYGPSLYLSAVVHRVVYAFYFVNVDPALCLGIPLLINFIAPESINTQRTLMAIWLGAAIVFFILFFPVHPGPGL